MNVTCVFATLSQEIASPGGTADAMAGFCAGTLCPGP